MASQQSRGITAYSSWQFWVTECLPDGVCAPSRSIFFVTWKVLVYSNTDVFRCFCSDQYFSTARNRKEAALCKEFHWARSPRSSPSFCFFLINALRISSNVFESYSFHNFSQTCSFQCGHDWPTKKYKLRPYGLFTWPPIPRLRDHCGRRHREVLRSKAEVRENRSGNNVFHTGQGCCPHELKAAVIGFPRSRPLTP